MKSELLLSQRLRHDDEQEIERVPLADTRELVVVLEPVEHSLEVGHFEPLLLFFKLVQVEVDNLVLLGDQEDFLIWHQDDLIMMEVGRLRHLSIHKYLNVAWGTVLILP